MGQFDPKPCCRCHASPASTPGNAYCKPCRAAYQRDWRARRRSAEAPADAALDPAAPRVRLRGTPTRAEMQRFGLI